MTADVFENQKKLRRAELIVPPNILKQKMGSGGIDPAALVKAQETIDKNTIDFRPIAKELVEQLTAAVKKAQEGSADSEVLLEGMIYPAMQMKAQGAMFHFPLVTDISDILVNFLETVNDVDKDVLEIVIAHKMAISAVISADMRGTGDAKGKVLRDSLLDACMRYYTAKEKLQNQVVPPEPLL